MAGYLPDGVAELDAHGDRIGGICDLLLLPGTERSVLWATTHVRVVDGKNRKWAGGVYKSSDGGKTWEESNTGLEKALKASARGTHTYSLIAGSRAHSQVLYWGSHPYGVFKTVNGGCSWLQVTHPAGKAVKAPDFDGTEIYWRLLERRGNYDRAYHYGFGPIHGLACSDAHPDIVAYIDNGGIALSRDGGEHWTVSGFEFGDAVWPGRFGDRPPMRLTHKVRSKGLHLIVPLDLAVDPFNPRTIAIGYADIGLMISRDGGQWWEWGYDGILGGEKNYIRAVVFDPKVRDRLWVAGGGWGTSGHVYRSDDGGRRFEVVGIDQLTHEASRREELLFVNSLLIGDQSPVEKRTLWAATDCGLFRTDGEQSWQRVRITPGPERIMQVSCDPRNPLQIYAGVISGVKNNNRGGLFRSTDGGKSWTQLAGRHIGQVRSLSVCGATGTLYVLENRPGFPFEGYLVERKVWRSDDGGDTWSNIGAPRFIASLAVHPENPDWVFLLTFADDVSKTLVNLFRSRDGGETWQALAGDIALSTSRSSNRIVFAPEDSSRFFVMHNSGVYEGRLEK
jgi:photosystem II stability/assembly factor-like uncharacterized protein